MRTTSAGRGQSRKDWRHRCTSEPSWKMRAMDTAGHEILRIRAARSRGAACVHSHEVGHFSVPFPPARSRPAAALIHSHPCGGRMAHLMEREGRDSKGLGNRKVPNPFGTLVATRTAVAGATIPPALPQGSLIQFPYIPQLFNLERLGKRHALAWAT